MKMDQRKHDRFVELFVRHQNRVYRFVLTLVPNREDAEELFQQTSLTLWKIWDRYDTKKDFTRWACGIAHNHIRNFKRRKERTMVLLPEDILELIAHDRLEQDDWLEERRKALAGCLESLPLDHKRLIERCYSGKESITKVANSRGQTANAIYKFLRRIRSELQECIARKLTTEFIS